MGSAIPVVNMDIRQQRVGSEVKHHAPTGASLSNRLPHNKISNKKINKKPSFSPCKVF